MASVNPFDFSRFEASSEQQLYIPKHFAKFEIGDNFYIAGGRGSGKTVLLKWLSWDQRQAGGLFAKSEAKDFSSKKLIGLYARIVDYEVPAFFGLEDHSSGQMVGTEGQQNIDICERLFTNYLAALQCSLLCDALTQLSATNGISVSAGEELDFVVRASDEWSDLRQLLELDVPSTFSQLNQLFLKFIKRVHRIGVAARNVEEVDAALLDSLADMPYRFTQILKQAAPSMNGWRYLFCVDEAESLKDWQQKCLNSFVRKRREPWGYVLAFIQGVYNTRETTIYGQYVGPDDAQTESLTNMGRRKFKEIVNGAIRERLRAANLPLLTLEMLVGDLGVNDLLEARLEKSENKAARTLLQMANELRPESPPPIYQAWLINNDSTLASYWSLPQADKRAIDSQRVRKKHISAYFAICRHLRIKPYYAGSDALINLADNCIRDMLRILHFAWARADLHQEKIKKWSGAKPLVPVTVQNQAIKEAALSKISDLAEDSVMPQNLTTLLRNLGEVQALKLRTDEAGLHEDIGGMIISQDVLGRARETQKIINEGTYCGVLFKLRSNGDVSIRLHNLIAPLYGLPYRKPQRFQKLSEKWVFQIAIKKFSPAELADFEKAKGQSPLPFLLSEDV